MMQGERTSRALSKASRRIGRKELLTFPGGLEGGDGLSGRTFQGKCYLSKVLKDNWGFMVLAVCTWARGECGDGRGLGLAGLQGTWGQGVGGEPDPLPLGLCQPTH